jgi:hypothetical protein
LEELSANGYMEMAYKSPTETIIFKTHEELDGYVWNLLKDSTWKGKNADRWNLLKGFDGAFW